MRFPSTWQKSVTEMEHIVIKHVCEKFTLHWAQNFAVRIH